MTPAQLANLSPATAQYAAALVAAAEWAEINTPLRQAHWLAQMGHESQGFTRTGENLNYSADGLLTTFHKYFTLAQAQDYARQPERIANHVYANRMGNGNEASGDGWAYRGSGLIHLTGRANYKACSIEVYEDERLLSHPEQLRVSPGAVDSAAWFWWINRINRFADADDLEGCTRVVNGGLHGLQERKVWLVRAKAALA